MHSNYQYINVVEMKKKKQILYRHKVSDLSHSPPMNVYKVGDYIGTVDCMNELSKSIDISVEQKQSCQQYIPREISLSECLCLTFLNFLIHNYFFLLLNDFFVRINFRIFYTLNLIIYVLYSTNINKYTKYIFNLHKIQ